MYDHPIEAFMLVHHPLVSRSSARVGGAFLVASAVVLPLALLAAPATAALGPVAPTSSTATVVASTIDVKSQVAVRGLQTGSVDTARNRLYLADAVSSGAQQMAQIDLATGTASLIPLGGGYAASDTAVSPLDGTVYVSHNAIGGGISVVDPDVTYTTASTPPVVQSGISTGIDNTQLLEVGTDGRVYALHSYKGVVSVVGASTGLDRLKVVQEIPIPSAPTGAMALDATRGRLYVVSQEAQLLTVINTADNPATVLGAIPLGSSQVVAGVGIDTRTGQVLLTDQASRTISWFTILPSPLAAITDRTESLGALPVGADDWSAPSSISVRPDGTTLVVTLVYAAKSQPSQVTVIPSVVSAATPVTTLTVGKMANGGILDPRAGGTLYVPSATSGTVAEITDVTLSGAATTAPAGSPATLRADVVRADGRALTGTVSFTDLGGAPLGDAPVQAHGDAELPIAAAPAGVLGFTAQVTAPAGIPLTAAGSLTATASASTTTLTLSPATGIEGGTTTAEVSVTAVGASPTGTFSIIDGAGGGVLATGTLTAGSARVTFPSPPAGTTTLVARYAGGLGVAGSDSAAVPLVITARVPVASAPSSSGSVGGTSSTTVSGFLPGENVVITLHSDPIYLGTVQADSTGSGTLTFAIPAVEAGSHTIVAVGQTSGRTALVPFTVTAAAPRATSPKADNLAATGSEPAPLAALAALMVLLGAGALAAARRRAAPSD